MCNLRAVAEQSRARVRRRLINLVIEMFKIKIIEFINLFEFISQVR